MIIPEVNDQFRLPAIDISLALQLAGAICGLAGQWFVTHKKVFGFYLWLCSNGALVWLQLSHGFYVLALQHCAYFAMSAHGVWVWNKQKVGRLSA